MSLSTIAYQIATDPSFEDQVRENPEQALADRGITLSDLEMKILHDMHQSEIHRLLAPGDDPSIQFEWGGIKPSHTSSN